MTYKKPPRLNLSFKREGFPLFIGNRFSIKSVSECSHDDCKPLILLAFQGFRPYSHSRLATYQVLIIRILNTLFIRFIHVF